MVTKEYESEKYCCFYVSDFHLEMILLPYIKNNIDKTKFIILTEEDLSESIKILLDRINLKDDEKNKILELNWNSKEIEDMNKLNNNKYTIIINGSTGYISRNNEKLKIFKNINIIDCYNISEENLEINKIKENYNNILNTEIL